MLLLTTGSGVDDLCSIVEFGISFGVATARHVLGTEDSLGILLTRDTVFFYTTGTIKLRRTQRNGDDFHLSDYQETSQTPSCGN